ncbi:glycosyltransferase [Candidatus Falkowbacteria bacterium]|nr:glycosyltransferase [Candidatus Falkowbacteria bacterium]
MPEFLRGLGVSEAKLHYASSMYIDTDIFKPMDVEKKYDLVFAGRLAKNKNVEMIIKAVKILKDRGKDVKCVIVGDGPEAESYKLLVKRYKLEGCIDFLGWLPGIEDVAKIYNQSRIFVMPSLNEGGPRVCLEAMACGVPVVTTRVGIMLDIIKEGENGYFCDWTPNDMAEKILKIRNSENMQLSLNARKTVEQFERGEMIRRLAETYRMIANC